MSVSPLKQAGIPAADGGARDRINPRTRNTRKRYLNTVSARRVNQLPFPVRGPCTLGTEVSAHQGLPNDARWPESAPDGLTACQSDADVSHRGIGFGSVPVALTRLDVSDVADLDLKSLGFGSDPPAARGDN